MATRRKKVPKEERAWQSYPLVEGRCSVCSGLVRETPGGSCCERGHGAAPLVAEEVAELINADKVPGIANASARVIDKHTLEVIAKKVGNASVTFHERATSRLEEYDLADLAAMNPKDGELCDVFVKVSAELRPSEREGFDGRALKEQLRTWGARAVLLAVHPVGETPDKDAKAETAAALRPEDSIAAWFDGLPIPEEDRAAARELALEILAQEEG